MTMQPLPVRPIPIWFGARSEAAYRRTVRIGDGWHGSQLTPEQAAPIVKRLRSERPEAEFTISMRTHWNGRDEAELRDRVAAFEAVGVQHIMVAPVDRDVDDWDAVIEGAGRLVRKT
jgi:luciferase-like monooxygenase